MAAEHAVEGVWGNLWDHVERVQKIATNGVVSFDLSLDNFVDVGGDLVEESAQLDKRALERVQIARQRLLAQTQWPYKKSINSILVLSWKG
eukprot:TRINITY_DN914_c0_g1_i2.p1 TRINITY_DN914_c0_g1~~TRINITY_DN914_c0_g1_i2.p1  ORF type:complete len:91 (+),score=9.47 TRINITY_DN914_c0_g1_i2:196-468(+)